MKLVALGAILASLAMPFVSPCQDADFQSQTQPKPKSYVVYEAEAHAITAGKSAMVELHFKVLEGFHINSHTPKADFLIPTKLTLEPAEGVTSAPFEYPAGTPYSFSFEPNEKLDVYSGAFTVKLPLVAVAGEHKLSGTLHYQACDHAACYPPNTLPVEVLFTAK